MPKSSGPSSRYRISNRKRLQGVVERLVRYYGDGKVNAAAGKMEIPQPTLWRLSRLTAPKNRLTSLSRSTLFHLEKATDALGREGRLLQRALAGSIMEPNALRLYRRGFVSWCREREERFLNRRGHVWEWSEGRPPRQITGRDRRYRFLQRSLNDLLSDTQAAFPELFEKFNKFAQSKGVSAERIRVAHVRVVEPLAEWRASAFFEPKGIELTREQLRLFIQHGFRREEILVELEPSNAQERANVLARGGVFRGRRRDLSLKG